MASSVGHLNYDENLASLAPAATKAQLQSGYNPDLLVEKQTPPPSRQDLAPSRGPERERELESQSPPPKQPFYRTTKGIIIIAVAIIVIIAAVVGGAVGGSKKHTSAATTSNGQGSPDGGAPAPANSTAVANSQVAGSTISGTGSSIATTTVSPAQTNQPASPSGINQEVGFVGNSG